MRKLSLVSVFLGLYLCSIASLAKTNLPDFSELIEKRSAAVVKITTVSKASQPRLQMPPGQEIPDIFRHFFEQRPRQERNASAMGSGFFISGDGYIVTNNHVIDGADKISVRLIDQREYDAVLVGTDPRSDLALLKVDAKDLPYLEFGNSDKLRLGNWVLAIGSPFGLDFSASVGIVSSIGRSIPTDKNENYVPFIQTDVAINPGNSGGPLFDLEGQVIGINSQIYTRSGGSIGLSFAIPSNVARNVISQLREKGTVDRGWLGVVIQEVDKDLADSFGLKKPAGALVAQMDPEGPAAKSGIEVGDIILRFDSSSIMKSGDLPHVVGLTPPGEKVPVEVIRQGKRKTIKVKVGALPGTKQAAAAVTKAETKVGGRLGVDVEEVDPKLRRSWNLSGGVLVTAVDPNGPAVKSGLRPGDVIAQLGFEQIEDVDHFTEIVKKLPKDSLLPIRFFREGRPTFRTVILLK